MTNIKFMFTGSFWMFHTKEYTLNNCDSILVKSIDVYNSENIIVVEHETYKEVYHGIKEYAICEEVEKTQ